MIRYKSPREIDLMRVAGRIVAEGIELARQHIRPGMSTVELDALVGDFIVSREAEIAFLGYRGFPKNICVSVNEEVVHGIPGSRVLQEGDIVSVDVGARYKRYFGDAAATFPVGKVSKKAEKLIRTTRECLDAAIELVRPHARLSEVSRAVESHARENGFSVVKRYVGHGIGIDLHEEPQVPNFDFTRTEQFDVVLKPGLVLAIEPMLNEKGEEVETLPDGWTVVTRDRGLSAHFEHTVAVTETGREVLTISDLKSEI